MPVYIGQLIPFGGLVTPKGWLRCDGRTLSKSNSDYAALFKVIQYTYGGSGDSFKIPDLRGRAPIGAGQGAGLTDRTVGSTGGLENVTLTINQMPPHSHVVQGAKGSDDQQGSPNLAHRKTATVHDDNGLIYDSGGGQPHDNMPPFLVVAWFIAYQGTAPSAADA